MSVSEVAWEGTQVLLHVSSINSLTWPSWPYSLMSLSVFVTSHKKRSPLRTPCGNMCVRIHQSLYAHFKAWLASWARQAHLRTHTPYPVEGQTPGPLCRRTWQRALCPGKKLLCGHFVGGLAPQQCNSTCQMLRLKSAAWSSGGRGTAIKKGGEHA